MSEKKMSFLWKKTRINIFLSARNVIKGFLLKDAHFIKLMKKSRGKPVF